MIEGLIKFMPAIAIEVATSWIIFPNNEEENVLL